MCAFAFRHVRWIPLYNIINKQKTINAVRCENPFATAVVAVVHVHPWVLSTSIDQLQPSYMALCRNWPGDWTWVVDGCIFEVLKSVVV